MKVFVFISMLLLLIACNNNDKDPATIGTTPSAPVSPANNPHNAYYPANQMILDGISLLRDGDLVVRNNQDFASQLIREFNKTDKSYTHGGIVIVENGYPMVYHIVAGSENPDEKLRKDSLVSFCNPRKNFGFAIYRYQLAPAELSAFKQSILDWYTQGLKFDMDFDLQTDDKMYCSEMIYKGLKKATNNKIMLGMTEPTMEEIKLYLQHTHSKRPVDKLAKMKFITTDNLYLNPMCRLVKKYSFQPAADSVK